MAEAASFNLGRLPISDSSGYSSETVTRENTDLSHKFVQDHVLVHMLRADSEVPLTSEKLAQIMDTNAVVVRRTFSGLKEAGLVSSQKGHGGGWRIVCDPSKVTLADIYKAVGAPAVLNISHRTEAPGCLIEQSVNAILENVFLDAEAAVNAQLQRVTLALLTADVTRRHEAKQERKGRKK